MRRFMRPLLGFNYAEVYEGGLCEGLCGGSPLRKKFGRKSFRLKLFSAILFFAKIVFGRKTIRSKKNSAKTFLGRKQIQPKTFSAEIFPQR